MSGACESVAETRRGAVANDLALLCKGGLISEGGADRNQHSPKLLAVKGSIQVTVDTYGHLIPGADVKWIDRLDSSEAAQQSATPAQPEGIKALREEMQTADLIGGPGGIRTPDQGIMSPLL